MKYNKDLIYRGVILPREIYGYYMLKDNFPELYIILEDYQRGATKYDCGWRIYFTFRDKQKQKIYYSELLEYKEKMNRFLRRFPQLYDTNYVYIYMLLEKFNQKIVDPEEDYFDVRIEKPRRHLMLRDFNRFDYIEYLKYHNIDVVSDNEEKE